MKPSYSLKNNLNQSRNSDKNLLHSGSSPYKFKNADTEKSKSPNTKLKIDKFGMISFDKNLLFKKR